MARKKGNKAKAQAAAAPLDSTNEPQAPLQSVDVNVDPDDIGEYPEVQQNEYLATQAIYPDEFTRVRGRKDAWKNQENLAFQVQLTSLENPEFFVKLDFEFPRDYPKVPLKARVIKVEPDNPKIRTQLDNITTNVTKAHIGSECVHEVTGAIDEVLNRSALSKAEKANPFSLEEERAKREDAARLASLQAQAQLLQHQQEAEAKGRQKLASQLDTERKRREDTTLKAKMPIEVCKPVEVDFERTLSCIDPLKERRVPFTKVDGRAVVLRRSDKINRLVSPQVPNNDAVNVPTLLLKEISLRHDLIAPDEMQLTMMRVEKLLQKSCELKDDNVVDIIGYKLLYPDRDQRRDDYVLYVLSEWSDAGSLSQMIQLSGRLPPEKVREYTRQILQALWFYEANNFIHPAVHSYNVIVFLSSFESVPSLRLSDGYGTALRELVEKARDKSAFLSKSLVPPKLWKAPELNDPSEGRSAATAMWDLGRIILEMALGKSIYDTFTSPKDCLKKTPFERNFSNVLYRLFRDDPSKRPTADAMRSSGFLSDHGPLLFEHVTSSGARSMSRKGTSSVPSRWHEEWENLGLVGKGGGGSVFRARKLTDQVVYAVKHIKVQSARQFEQDRSEILNLAKLQHPSIVRYYDAWAEAEASDHTDSETTGPTQTDYHPPSSMTGKNSEMVDYLVDELSKQGGQSKLDMRKNTMSMRFRGKSSPPPPPRFQQTFNSVARGPDYDESDDESDEADDDGQEDDNSDDYDNAFGGDAKVDPALLEDEVPENPPADKDQDVFETDSQAVEDDGGVAVSSSAGAITHKITPNRRRRSTFERGTLYIQMELCEGRTLKSLIGPSLCKNVDHVWELLRGILVGLAYIHGENIAHRDLKPDNIFLGAGNIPKIGDFGLATANAARKAGSGVGTIFYIAPELEHGREISDMSKVDMFSLGIMLFEMTYPLPTLMERGVTLGAINADPKQMPQERYEKPAYQEQGQMIRRLISHKPEERPSASDLLDSGKIPEPVEEGKLDRRLAWMAQHDPKTLAGMFSKAETTDVQDLAWEHIPIGTEKPDELDLLCNLVQERLEATFRKHGAVSTSRQVLLPKNAETAEKAVALFNPAFMSLQLRKDMTTPFARAIAKNKPQHIKSFCFGDVYESRQENGDAEPKHNPRANFDFVSSKASDIALKEASTIYVIQDIIGQFSPLSSMRWTILLNHLDLMDLILDHCGIRKEDWLKVKELLSRFNYGGSSDRQRLQQWKVFEKALRTRYNIADTSVAELGKFAGIKGKPQSVREALRTGFRKNTTKISQAMGLLQRLEDIITYLERLRFSLKVLVAPLSNSDAHLYAGSVVFECIDEDSGQSLANGGRYDSLIERHAWVSKDPSPRAVGFSINVASVAHMLTEAAGNDNATKGKAKPGKGASGNTAAVSAAPLPARVDVLVTSFDAELLTTRCLDVLRDLWAAGVSAELTEEVESMEQLEELHASDGPFWLVMVRLAGEEVTVKVRSPGGDETTVEADGLAAWLRVEVRREKKGGK